MTPALVFALRYWKQIGVALLATILAIYVSSLRSEIDSLNEHLRASVAETEVCLVQRGQLTAAIEEQNASIRALEEAGRRNKAAIARAQKKIKTISESSDRLIRDIANAPIEPTCEGGMASLRARARELSTWTTD